MERNRELFLKLAAKIRSVPKCYDQSTWGESVEKSTEVPCGTVACIAGHTCLLAGWHPTIHLSGCYDYTSFSKQKNQPTDRDEEGQEYVQDIAQRELGITRQEAFYLFDAGWHPAENNYPDVATALEAFANGAKIYPYE